jgi:hypothetical protein
MKNADPTLVKSLLVRARFLLIPITAAYCEVTLLERASEQRRHQDWRHELTFITTLSTNCKT